MQAMAQKQGMPPLQLCFEAVMTGTEKKSLSVQVIEMRQQNIIQTNLKLILAASFSTTMLSIFAWLVVTDMIVENNQLPGSHQPCMLELASRYYGGYAMARD